MTHRVHVRNHLVFFWSCGLKRKMYLTKRFDILQLFQNKWQKYISKSVFIIKQWLIFFVTSGLQMEMAYKLSLRYTLRDVSACLGWVGVKKILIANSFFLVFNTYGKGIYISLWILFLFLYTYFFRHFNWYFTLKTNKMFSFHMAIYNLQIVFNLRLPRSILCIILVIW